MAIKLNAPSSPFEDANETFDTSEVMRLGKLWSQARSVHPDDTTRQNAAFLDALAAFEDLVRNAALDEAADACGFGMSMIEKEIQIADKIRSLKK